MNLKAAFPARRGRRPVSILDKILANKKREVEKLRVTLDFRALARETRPSRLRFRQALRRPGPSFILEYKRSSPSQGGLFRGQAPDKVAAAYRPFADAVSVLTDREYFGGDFSDLAAFRCEVRQPILCKDFILDEIQILMARRAGADAILLILAAIGDAAYRSLSRVAAALGMDVLTEVHTAEEMRRAAALGASLVGINNRDLARLVVSPEVTERLAPLAPPEAVLVSESGIQSRADIARLAPLVDGFLIGNALMRSPAPEHIIRHLVMGDVKICGLTRGKDARAAFAAGARYGGLIFIPGTPRAVNYLQAGAVIDGAPLSWAGIFRDAPLEKVAGLARQFRLEAVQLHGFESEAYRRSLRALLPSACEIWQAVRIEQRLAQSFFPFADRILLDSHKEGRLGGTGRPLDWRRLDSLKGKDRLILAGGINPENVQQALKTGVGLLDVGSGVEEARGIKSAAKLKALFAAIRNTAFKTARAEVVA
jgi:indole-3-glycerol phosphate synthase / phosphoribosylanthranilate isomerase